MDVSNRRREPNGRFADEDRGPFDSVGDLTDAGETADGDVAVGLPGDGGLMEGVEIGARPTLRGSDSPGYEPVPRSLSDGLCPHTRKVAYPSGDNAAKALAIVRRNSAIDPRRHERSYYRCPTCHEWHLTSHDWDDAGSIRFDGVELAAQHREEFHKGLAWLCPERRGEIPKDEYRAKRGSVHMLMRSFDRAGIPVEDWSNPWLWACARKATLPLDDGFEARCKRFTLAAKRLRSENPEGTVRGDAKGPSPTGSARVWATGPSGTAGCCSAPPRRTGWSRRPGGPRTSAVASTGCATRAAPCGGSRRRAASPRRAEIREDPPLRGGGSFFCGRGQSMSAASSVSTLPSACNPRS